MSRYTVGPEMTPDQREAARRAGRFAIHEDEHRVVKLLKWLPAGMTEHGDIREKDLIQFTAKHGGIRTLAVEDIVLIRK